MLKCATTVTLALPAIMSIVKITPLNGAKDVDSKDNVTKRDKRKEFFGSNDVYFL